MSGIKNIKTASIEGDFVVLLLGVRVNKLWKIWKWLPVFQALPKMTAELKANPDLGLLHERSHFGFPNTLNIQYWRSWEHLRAYSNAPGGRHKKAWAAFYKTLGQNEDVGIWHETFLVPAGQFETIYGNMPPYGIGAFGELSPVGRATKTAQERLDL